MRFLTREQARAFYDRLGRRQDWQRFYEGRAIRELIAHGDFNTAHRVFELGCGTGSFAATLLEHQLPRGASYTGVDLSATMTALTRQRLSGFGARAQVSQSDGSLRFDVEDESFDRFVANYVLDLLPPQDIVEVLEDAHRLLRAGGRLCLISLTHGKTWPSRLVIKAWTGLHNLNPSLVGGCRPVELTNFLNEDQWRVDYRKTVTALAVPSEVVVASKRD